MSRLSKLEHWLWAVALLFAHRTTHNAAAPPCEVSHWEKRLDIDLTRFERSGITLDDLDHATKQPCGGYKVSIVNNQLYATPLGWESMPQVVEQRRPHPHAFLKMFANMMCLYSVPNVTFVMNTYDRLCVEDRSRLVPVVSWGKDTMADDSQLLMPYWTFTHLKQDVDQLGSGPPWDDRTEVAVWRGTTTGGYFTDYNWHQFPRGHLVRLCNNSRYCDAKFTGYPQATKEAQQAIRDSGFHGEKLSASEFLGYKYIIVNDGNMAPSSRLSIYLHSGSLLLKQESPSIEFYYNDLQPFVHYLPLSYNFGDVEHKVKWAQHHDKRCKDIAARALAYAQENLTLSNVHCYMYRLLLRYSKAQRFDAGLQANSTWQHVPGYCGHARASRRRRQWRHR